VDVYSFSFARYFFSYYPVFLIILSQLVYGNFSRLIINNKAGVIAFAAITLAFQIVNLISIFQSQIDRHIRPMVIDAVHAGDWPALKALTKSYIVFYLVPIMLGCIILGVFSVQIMGILFGPKWSEAGHALSYASPLILTIACMRFLDILVIPLHAAKMNLLVNIIAGGALFSLLWLNRNTTLVSYVVLIVLCQTAHVAFMTTYVYARLKRDIMLRG
jgi:O-antigen/teichoic acid export membrane protein